MADQTGLKPAADMAEAVSKPYPNDSADYRAARTALLAEEIELRRHIERVAARRRRLPAGGAVPQDYLFTGEDGQPIRLSQMFGSSPTLIVYTWMFGPRRERPCSMCTAMLGSLDGEAADIAQRVALAIVGKSPIARQIAFKRERGWSNLQFFSSGDNGFTRDYRGEGPDGEDWAAFNVFTRDAEGIVRHFWGGELDFETADPGEDPRGAPDPMPLWNLLDMTPEGRGADWYPKLAYPGAETSPGRINAEAVRAILQAYAAGDRPAAERLIADDVRFTSPLDNGLDRNAYFERCWPNSATLAGFDIVNLVPNGDRVFVTYEAHTTDGRRFRNTEIITLRGGKIVEVEVYFGWNLPHPAPKGGSVPPPRP